MKLYRGRRTEAGCVVLVVEDGEERQLDPRLDLRNHSPDGLEWGYSGSGPAQLALALLADHLRDLYPADEADEIAERYHQAVKADAVASIAGDTWELTAEQVGNVLGLHRGPAQVAAEPLPGADEDVDDELADDTEADARAHADIMGDDDSEPLITEAQSEAIRQDLDDAGLIDPALAAARGQPAPARRGQA